ncbi:MAG: leucine-rich repeat protein, partial [Paludibacteraceae bacterium]|nr:leucine-rich repeat protein [Paludibacteraceae bacterium]
HRSVTYRVTSIEPKALAYCAELTSVTIPNSVTSISSNALEGNPKLTKVSIGSGVSYIGSLAFGMCYALQEFQVSPSNPYYCSVNGVLFSKDKTTLVTCPCGRRGEYAIPDGVKTIGNSAFCCCVYLTSITIPNSVTTIKNYGLSHCMGLKSLIIPNSVTSIGERALQACEKLTTLTIPNSVTSVGDDAFVLCKGLKEIYYPKNLDLSKAGIPSAVKLIAYDGNNKPIPVQQQAATPSPAPKNTNPAETTATNPTVKPSVSAVDVNIPETRAKNPNTFVVIFANENYKNVAAVPFAKNDGTIFRQYCQKTLGIPHTNIHYVENASYNDIRLELAWLKNVCEQYEGTASVILYYAGHGIPDASDKSAYLLPVDGDGRYVATGYKLDELYEKLGDMPTKSVVVLLDACFSGANKDGKMLASERGVAIKSRPGMPKGNTVVFSAAQGDETALPNEAEGHGMFTYYILKKLLETKGDVTLQDLSQYVIREVGRISAVQNKPQTPTITPAVAVSDEWKSWKLK